MTSENLEKDKPLSPEERFDFLIKAGRAHRNEPGDDGIEEHKPLSPERWDLMMKAAEASRNDPEWRRRSEDHSYARLAMEDDRRKNKLEGELQVEAGLLVRGQVRNYLNAAIFKGIKIEYLECKGLLSSVFIIKGPKNARRQIRQGLKNG